MARNDAEKAYHECVMCDRCGQKTQITFRSQGRVVCFVCFVEILHGDISEEFRKIRVVPKRVKRQALLSVEGEGKCETCLAEGPILVADGYRLCVPCALGRIDSLPT